MVKQNRWKILLLLENDCTSSLIVMVDSVKKKFGFEITFGKRPKIKKNFQNFRKWTIQKSDQLKMGKDRSWFIVQTGSKFLVMLHFDGPGWMILHTNWGSDVTKFEQNDPSKFSSFDWSIQVATNVEIDQSFLPKQLFTKTG